MKIFRTFCVLITFGIIVILVFINVIGFKSHAHVVNLNFNSNNFFMNKDKNLMVEDHAPSKKGLSFRIHDKDTDSLQLLHIEKDDDSAKIAKKIKLKDFDDEKQVTLTTDSTNKVSNEFEGIHSMKNLTKCSRSNMKLGKFD